MSNQKQITEGPVSVYNVEEVRKAEAKVYYKSILLSNLEFDERNNRIFRWVTVERRGKVDQEDVAGKLESQNSVHKLMKQLQNDGVMHDDMIAVEKNGSYKKATKFEVIEGNQRLAAVRLLSQKDPKNWGTARCKVYPKETPGAYIERMKVNWHVLGKSAWQNHEIGLKLSDDLKNKKYTLKELCQLHGKKRAIPEIDMMGKIQASRLIEEQNLASSKWSMWYEYFKNKDVFDFNEKLQEEKNGTAERNGKKISALTEQVIQDSEVATSRGEAPPLESSQNIRKVVKAIRNNPVLAKKYATTQEVKFSHITEGLDEEDANVKKVVTFSKFLNTPSSMQALKKKIKIGEDEGKELKIHLQRVKDNINQFLLKDDSDEEDDEIEF